MAPVHHQVRRTNTTAKPTQVTNKEDEHKLTLSHTSTLLCSLFSVLCSFSVLPSSAVGDLDQGGEEGWISVHIRIIPGGWTENTLRYFCAMNGRDLNEDDLKNDLFLSLTSRDAKGKT